MEPDARPICLAFAGTFSGGFALAIACLSGDSGAALVALAATAYCAAEFVCATGLAQRS